MSKTTLPKGITRFTIPPTAFNGFRVSKTVNSYIFTRYVPCSRYGKVRDTLLVAENFLGQLMHLLEAPRAWSRCRFTAKTLAGAKQLGFTVRKPS